MSAAGRTSTRAELRPDSWVERYVYVSVLDGPRGRLGVVWFLVALVAAIVGLVPVAVLFAAVAALAGLEVATAWRRLGRGDVRLAAGVGAGILPLAALVGTGFTGLAVLGVVALAAVVAVLRPGRGTVVSRTALGVRCSVYLGVPAACVVLIGQADSAALVILLVLISGYEVGDYLIGTGANTPIEGPIAGIAAVMVLTFGLAVFQFSPFDDRSAWIFGGLVAVLAPLGAIAASAVAPSARLRAPALRRLDAWLVVAPVWLWMLWDYLPR